MKKHNKPVELDRTLTALYDTATLRTQEMGHTIGRWEPAKKKHGIGSMKCMCHQCGQGVVVIPYYWYKHDNKEIRVPAMKGDALFFRCQGGVK